MGIDRDRERRGLGRRQFLVGTGATAGLLVLGARPSAASSARSTGATGATGGLFTLGVASGEPLPDGVVLWTRLAPDPLNGGGMRPGAVDVDWQVAADPTFDSIVRKGTAIASERSAHSVHALVRGLASGREYWYRFRAGGEISPVGRTRTAPAAGAPLGRLRFAFASCQSWAAGYYNAHRHLAEEDLDLVVFLGDYIYESTLGGTGPRAATPLPEAVRPEPFSVTDYRNRHALYRLDPDLQAAHAAHPWVVTFDDHEVDNNWADEVPQDPADQPPDVFLARRAAAFQAYYEHMPLRPLSIPEGIDLRLYRRLAYGDLAAFHVLDTRQYRSDQVLTPPEALDPNRTMLGPEQEAWLYRGLDRSSARWNVLAQQVFLAQNDRVPGPAQGFDLDNWDGYVAPRQRLLDFLHRRQPSNPVVITGDRHVTWVCDLKLDFADPSSPTVGSELVGTSLTSGGDPVPGLLEALYGQIMAESPHWKYMNDERGYLRCDLDHARWQTDVRVVPTVLTRGGGVETRASFVVQDGVRGVSPIA